MICLESSEPIDPPAPVINTLLPCKRDSIERWGGYKLSDLDKYDYKVEVLDDKKEWVKYTDPQKAFNQFKLDGKHGLKLGLADGAGAIYLPVVARDHEWTKNSYLESLTLKAYGTQTKDGRENNWKKAKV